MRAAVLALFVGIALATNGVDVSQGYGVNVFQCLKQNGYDFAIIRAYCSTGHVDSNSVHTVHNAWQGGMKHVDIYMFPCPKCGNPSVQVNDMLNYQRQYNTTYGMVWLDIEGSQYWMDQNSNRNFFNGLVSAMKSHGIHFGVYTNQNEWSQVMGLSFTGGSSLPLWYAHWDGSKSFSDFKPFSGWTKPAMKQIHGDITVCGANVDTDWYA